LQLAERALAEGRDLTFQEVFEAFGHSPAKARELAEALAAEQPLRAKLD
jgi:hypothetical protein